MSLPDRSRKHLLDVDRAIRELTEFGAGKSLEDLTGDRGLQLIFEREFEILGEAMSRFLRDEPQRALAITHIHRIIGLRNILAHGYDAIDYSILWSAVVHHLPQLHEEVRDMLGDADPLGT